jgi:hypothetical protein
MHQFKVHFDNYREFEVTVRQFTQRLQLDLDQPWRYTTAGVELIEFCNRYYPNWWRRLDPLL